MMKRPPLPDIPDAERSPLVETLLTVIEALWETAQRQEEEIGCLKDEIAVLKGEKTRPRFKPSGMEPETAQGAEQEGASEGKDQPKRPGSEKRCKTQELTIHADKVIAPAAVPAGSRFKGYRDTIVQDMRIEAHNTRYRLECWQTPDGATLCGELPAEIEGHFGPCVETLVKYLHHHARVTQPLIGEMLREWGVDISTGQIDALLSAGQERYRQEKDALLQTGLAVSDAVTVDDTTHRHQGQNGYTTHIGNEHFAWFTSHPHKNRLNFLCLLRAGETGWMLTEAGFAYMKQQGLAQEVIDRLKAHSQQTFADEAAWRAHLSALEIVGDRAVRIAGEGAQFGALVQNDLWQKLVIVSDDAGQFDVPGLLHALCWVHSERLVHKLIPLNDAHRQVQAAVRGQIWELYRDLKAYSLAPDAAQKVELETRFDAVFTQKTAYATLNALLGRLYRNKEDLLQVLEHPRTPLHTNGSERDLREQAIRRKISGGTRSDLGRQCRDTFLSLKKTCRKLGVSFWHYLLDRTVGTAIIPPLPELVRQRAEALAAGY